MFKKFLEKFPKTYKLGVSISFISDIKMKTYSLKNVSKIYSFYGKSPVLYKISNYMAFFGKEDFLRKKAVDMLNLREGGKVLDLACGMGGNFYYLLSKIGTEGIIMGVDYTEDMLNSAKKNVDKKCWKNVRLIKKDAAKLDFPKNYFDGVISTIGISAIHNHREALKRSVYSLKNGKRMVILDGKLFNGFYKILNPFMDCIRFSASWDKSKDIISDAKRFLKDVSAEEFLGGSIFILSGVKKR